MRDPVKGRPSEARRPPRPPSARREARVPAGESSPAGVRAGDARRPVPARPVGGAKRTPLDRTKVAFATLGLVVVVSLILGSVISVFDPTAGGDDAPDPGARRPGDNLVPTYEARLRDDPEDVGTMIVLANILQNRGDYPGAIGWYERAVALKPDDPEVRLAFGQALRSYGQRFDAEVQYKKALDIEATGDRAAKAHYYLGELYERWDPPRFEEARQRYGRASELQPEGSWGRAGRGALDRLNATPTARP